MDNENKKVTRPLSLSCGCCGASKNIDVTSQDKGICKNCGFNWDLSSPPSQILTEVLRFRRTFVN